MKNIKTIQLYRAYTTECQKIKLTYKYIYIHTHTQESFRN
jgi:hypothetical protein